MRLHINFFHLLNEGNAIFFTDSYKGVQVLVYMVISYFFSKVEGIWVISTPFKTAAPTHIKKIIVQSDSNKYSLIISS